MNYLKLIKAAYSEKDKTNYLKCEKCGMGYRAGDNPTGWVNTSQHTFCPECAKSKS